MVVSTGIAVNCIRTALNTKPPPLIESGGGSKGEWPLNSIPSCVHC